jgi:hypothetical protein
MGGLADSINHFLVKLIGYEATTMAEDLITYLSGTMLGLVIGVLLYSYVLTRIRICRTLDKDISVMYVQETDNYVFNPRSYCDYIEVLCIALYWTVCKSARDKEPHLRLKDSKRIRYILLWIGIFALIFILIGAWFTIDVFVE